MPELLKRTWAPLATAMLVEGNIGSAEFCPKGPVGSLGLAPVRSRPALTVIVPVNVLPELLSTQPLAPFLTIESGAEVTPSVGSVSWAVMTLGLKLVALGSRPVRVRVRAVTGPMLVNVPLSVRALVPTGEASMVPPPGPSERVRLLFWLPAAGVQRSVPLSRMMPPSPVPTGLGVPTVGRLAVTIVPPPLMVVAPL